MATDIAFAIGALVLLGQRVPKALITFLVALAIVDDLGAVIVIALFYTDGLVMGAFWVALGLLAVLVALNLGGIRAALPYFIVGVLLWYALLKSGVHATLAGVLVAFTIPARPKYDPARFSTQVRALLARFNASRRAGGSVLANVNLRAILQTLRNGVDRVETPLQRQEHFWQLPVAAVVVPVFALFNAGVPLELGALGQTVSHPVFAGVVLGLMLENSLALPAPAGSPSGLGWDSYRRGRALPRSPPCRCWRVSALPWRSSSPSLLLPRVPICCMSPRSVFWRRRCWPAPAALPGCGGWGGAGHREVGGVQPCARPLV